MQPIPVLLRDSQREHLGFKFSWLGSVLAALGVFWSPLQAQQARPQESFNEAITVREITIYVRVMGPRGPMKGLERSAFSTILRDQELPIVGFQEMVAYAKKRERREEQAKQVKRAKTDGKRSEPAILPRNILFVFDVMFTESSYLQEGVKGVRRVLDKLGPRDRVAVVRLGARADLITPFTSDPEQIDAALDFVEAALNADHKGALSAGARLQAKLGAGRALFGGGFGLRTELTRSGSGLLSIAPTIQMRFETHDTTDSFGPARIAEQSAVTQSIQIANRAFSDLARALSDTEGPRIAMFLAKGMPGFVKVLEYSTEPDAKSPLINSYQRLVSKLVASGWMVDAFDVTGVGGRGTSFSMSDNAPRPELDSAQVAAQPAWVRRGGLAGNDSDSLFFVANSTGGTLYDNFNRLNVAFEKSLQNSNHAYQLIVQIPDSRELLARRGGSKIKIQVAGVPLRARVTHSYAADWRLPASLRSKSPADKIRSDLLGGGEAKTPSPLLANVSIFREPLRNFRGRSAAAAGLQRAVVVVEAEKSLFANSSHPRPSGLSLHAISLPRFTRGSEGAFYDLWVADESWGSGANLHEQVIMMGDLMVPCEGGQIKVRLSGKDSNTSWVLTRTLADTCGGSQGWATPIEASDARTMSVEPSLVLSSATTIPFLDPTSEVMPKIRASVVQGESLEFLVRTPNSPEGQASEDLTLLLYPLGDGEPLQRQAKMMTKSDAPDAAVLVQLTFNVPAGHYKVFLDSDQGRESGAIVSVF